MAVKENSRSDCKPINPEDVEFVKNLMLDEDEYIGVASLLRHFGDPTRVKLLYALHKKSLCVSDLSVLLDITKSAVSHQLNALKLSKLVRAKRDGQVVYYSLDDDHVALILQMGFEHLHEG